MQYGVALLMNLANTKKGIVLFDQSKRDVFGVLKLYMNLSSNEELQTCIHGSIYCLLAKKTLKEKAI